MTTFATIYDEYYKLYRGEAEAPDVTDDEFIVALSYGNTAIRRWAQYDNTMWKNLYVNSLDAADGVTVTTAGTATYAAPTNMHKAGGFVKLKNASGTTQSIIPIIEPHEAQFKGDNSKYCYFSGDPNHGFTLHINPTPDTSNLDIEYIYYKSPTLMTDSSSVPDVSNVDFMVNHMLANRYRATRNPYYNTAKRDAENMLGQMKLENDSGSWANPWTVPDNSGTVFGQETGSGWRF